MENPLITVLMITVVGMGLLFLTLAFFYGMLTGMARGLRDRARPPQEEPAATAEEAPSSAATPWQAAAVAIALARGRVQSTPPGPVPQAEAGSGPPPPSAWWSLHHQRRLASRASRGRGE